MIWAERWRAVLDDADPAIARRVARGREYARAGRVTSLVVTAGELSGRVHGSRATPQAVAAAIPVFDDAEWRSVIDVLLSQARHSARLLAGSAPDGLEDELQAVRIALFPHVKSLKFNCSCTDVRTPCSHAAALWEAAATTLATDPFLLFRLRGRGRERLLADLAAARRPRAEEHGRGGVAVASLALQDWAHAQVPLDTLTVPAVRRSGVAVVALQVLGDPPGWTGGVSALDLLGPHIERAAEWIRDLET